MRKMMNMEEFQKLKVSMNIAEIFEFFGDLISDEIKETLSFDDWDRIYLRSMPSTFAELRAESFRRMFSLAKTVDEVLITCGYSEVDSLEEQDMLKRMGDESFADLDGWIAIRAKNLASRHGDFHAKVRQFAERRIREIIENKTE